VEDNGWEFSDIIYLKCLACFSGSTAMLKVREFDFILSKGLSKTGEEESYYISKGEGGSIFKVYF